MSPTESAWRALRATMNIRLPGDEEPEPPMPPKVRVNHGFHRGPNPKRDYAQEKSKSIAAKLNPGEITYKEWLLAEAEKHHLTKAGVRARVAAGKYPDLKRRVVNSRVVFVKV